MCRYEQVCEEVCLNSVDVRHVISGRSSNRVVSRWNWFLGYWKSWFEQDSALVVAVQCEPGSAPNSLLIREITGNFMRLALFTLPTSANGPANSVSSGAIPCKIHQGIILLEQGI